MKKLKSIATVAILSPLAVVLLFAVFLVYAGLSAYGMAEEQMWGSSLLFAVAMFYLSILVAVLFIVGTALHGVVAARSGNACRWAWWYVMAISVLMATVIRPLGTIIGVLAIVALLICKPFKIMRRGVEPAPRHVPSKAAADGGL